MHIYYLGRVGIFECSNNLEQSSFDTIDTILWTIDIDINDREVIAHGLCKASMS